MAQLDYQQLFEKYNCNHLPKELVEQMIKDRKVRIAVCQQSFFIFFHFYFAHYVQYKTAPFQREIFHLVENEKDKNLFIIAFRGSGKSTILTTAYPIWAILGQQQKKFVLILCQTRSQAKQHMMNLRRELEANQLLKDDLGPFEEESDEWGANSLVFSRWNVRITAASTEQSIRGLRHNQYRPDLIIGDDVEDLSSTRNRESRQKTYQWFTGEVIPAGDKNTRLIMVGNLLHEDSLLVHLRNDLEEKQINGIFKAYPLLDEQNTVAWPGKYPTENDIEIEKKKLGNEIAWQREYLLKILPLEDQVIHYDWIKRYDELPSIDEKDYRYTWAGVDLAVSEKETADYTAIVGAQVHGQRRKRKIYILPNPINRRILIPDLVELCKDYIRNVLHHGKLLIEGVAFQTWLAQLLHQDGQYVEAVPVHGDKRSRLAMISPLIQNGTILFPQKGAEILIQQLVGFGAEKHEDLVDAFTLLVHKLIEDDERARPNITIITEDGWEDLIHYDDDWED